MPGRFYSDTANRLLLAFSSASDDKVAMTRASRLACEALRILSNDLGPDGDLRWAITHLGQLSTDQADQYKEALQGSRALFEVFLVTEVRALRKARMPADVVELVRRHASEARHALATLPLDATQLQDRVVALQRTVCVHADQFQEIGRMARFVKGAAYVLAGGSTISINASVDAVTTLGLAPWMTAISGAVGGGLILKPFE